MVVFDQEVCTGCGLCQKECPGGAIRIKDQKASWVKLCIQCGHCVAICPVGAVSIPEYDMEDVEEYDPKTFAVDPEKMYRSIKFRRSIRDFKPEPIEGEKLEKIIKAGRYTATAKNMQECRFILIQEQLEEFKSLLWKEMARISEELSQKNPEYGKLFRYFIKVKERENKDPLFFNAPAFLMIASTDPVWNSLDSGLAASNIENMAVSYGAGVLYSGYLMRIIGASEALQEWLGIRGKEIGCCMLVGYPNVRFKRTAPRRKGDIILR